MLDRLSAGLVTLPDSTYDLILILTDANGTRAESAQLLGRDVFGKIVQALKAGGKLEAQDGTFGKDPTSNESREAILAGLVPEGDKMVKPDSSASEAVPLRFRRKDKSAAVSSAGPAVATATVQVNGKRKSVDMTQSKPAGVGFVDFSDDFGDPMDDDDDELIDEDTLLTEEEMRRPMDMRNSPDFAPLSFLTIHSTRMYPPSRKAPPSMQRLHMRTRREDSSRRCIQTRNRRLSTQRSQARSR